VIWSIKRLRAMEAVSQIVRTFYDEVVDRFFYVWAVWISCACSVLFNK
jgi:hypothetical protein